MLPFLLLPQVAGELGAIGTKSAAEVGFTGGWGSVPEATRLELRRQAGWKWEFPGESSEYAAVQEKRYAEILRLDHYQERLDNFVQYTQARIVKNFTRLGFEVALFDRDLHERLLGRLASKLETARREGRVQGIYGPTEPRFVNHGERDILKIVKPQLEAWVSQSAPEGLLPVTAYGARVYERGSSLAFHTDRIDTHVISAILHVAHEGGAPWPIEIEGHDGRRRAVALEPGQMLLYESAKCPHGRPTEFTGDWYAAVFVHFKPRVGWPYTHHDVWLAMPPGWDAGVRVRDPRDPGARWAGAFLTHDSMVVHGMPPRPEVPSRQDEYPAPPADQVSPPPPPPPERESRELPRTVERNLVARSAPAPAASKRRVAEQRRNKIPRHRRHQRRLPDDDDGPPPDDDDDDDDDDDEVRTAAAVGGGFVVAFGLYGLGACAVVSTIGVVARRALLTRGRSLVRRKQKKQDLEAQP